MDNICKWTVDADAVWYTSCGEAHVFFDGGPQDNKYKFCPYCGAILEQQTEVMGSVEKPGME